MNFTPAERVQVRDNLLIDVAAGVSIGFMVIPQGTAPMTVSCSPIYGDLHASGAFMHDHIHMLQGRLHCHSEFA